MKSEHDMLDVSEIAAELKISPRTIYKLFNEGILKGRNMGGQRGWITSRACVLAYVASGNAETEDECHDDVNASNEAPTSADSK